MFNNINIPFYVRYDEGNLSHSLSGIGESIMGLENLLIGLVGISGIEKKEIVIEIKEVKSGCIIFGLDVNIIVLIQLFKDIKDLYDIVDFIKPDLQNIGLDILDLHRKINDFASENPVDYDVIKLIFQLSSFSSILGLFLKRLLKILPNQKESVSISCDGHIIPKKIAVKSHKFIKGNFFKKTLSPFVDGKIKNIDFGIDDGFVDPVNINSNNFGNYLSEDQKILENWKDGDLKSITGKFVSWQIKKGKSLTFRVDGIKKRGLKDMICFPDENKDINDLIPFLPLDDLTLEVKISRGNLYEKPRLIILDIYETKIKLDI